MISKQVGILLALTVPLALASTKVQVSSSDDNGIVYNNTDPDIHRSFQEIVEENGFVFEAHHTTTEDGYILNFFRIPGAKTETSFTGKQPVLFWHGLFDSADCWIMNSADVAAGF